METQEGRMESVSTETSTPRAIQRLRQDETEYQDERARTLSLISLSRSALRCGRSRDRDKTCENIETKYFQTYLDFSLLLLKEYSKEKSALLRNTFRKMIVNIHAKTIEIEREKGMRELEGRRQDIANKNDMELSIAFRNISPVPSVPLDDSQIKEGKKHYSFTQKRDAKIERYFITILKLNAPESEMEVERHPDGNMKTLHIFIPEILLESNHDSVRKIIDAINIFKEEAKEKIEVKNKKCCVLL